MVRPVRYQSWNARRLVVALSALVSVIVAGTLGYIALGIDPLDATYQTVTTVTTIGFREVVDFDTSQKIFTMVLALVGVGTVLYTLTLTLELVLEGQLGNLWGRRRMQRDIDQLVGHAIVCGYGRVGRAAAEQISRTGQHVVVVDIDEERLATCAYPHVLGDASADEVLVDVEVHAGSSLVGATVADIRALEGGGALLLALRTDGHFVTNPPVESRFGVGDVLIVVGTDVQVQDLHRRAHA